MPHSFPRRDFLRTAAAGAAGLALTRRAATSAPLANGKLRLAAIGVGNKGRDDLQNISASPRVEVVAICDVDDTRDHLGWAAEAFPRAERFADFRELLDRENAFDAVSVSTPDHMHAPIALAAMALGKHVFCQKPLTHTVHEARLMRDTAAKHNLVTQMGNQIQSDRAYRNAVQLVHDGAIGKVREVHSWQSADMGWMLADERPAGSDPVPPSLQWDLWLGVAPERPYKQQLYHPFNWRAWQDFSSGQLGDFGCHILDPVFMALELTAPTTIRAEAPPLNKDVWSRESKVAYTFPGTQRTAGASIPLTWYDGKGHKPPRDGLGLPEDYQLPDAGSVLVGDAGTLVIPHWAAPRLFPEEKFADYAMPERGDVNHYTSWAHACLGDGTATSNFDYSGPLTETVLLGTIAIRFPQESLAWDATAGAFAGIDAANARLTKEYRSDWELPQL